METVSVKLKVRKEKVHCKGNSKNRLLASMRMRHSTQWWMPQDKRRMVRCCGGGGVSNEL